MISRSTWLHLRLPFSFLLMPVFCFAVGVAQEGSWWNLFLIFFTLHILVYPASNAYNSYYDKDEDSIGGLKNPPPVSKELLYTSLIMDGIAILLGLLVNIYFALGLLIYGLVSKAYSYDKIRLKKYPLTSWLVIGLFQGAFIFLMVYQGLSGVALSAFTTNKIWMGAFLSAWMFWGSYPMTQIYQHEEDARRGDLTLSRMLGIRGTFIFAILIFGGAAVGYFLYFWTFYNFSLAIFYQLAMFPIVAYFLWWFYQVWQDDSKANFESTMRLNLISAVCMNIFFIAFGVLGSSLG